jgi:hypothetical protein
MGASSPMDPVYQGKRVKIFRAGESHVYPGLHLWLGAKHGHLRFWPPPIKVVKS